MSAYNNNYIYVAHHQMTGHLTRPRNLRSGCFAHDAKEGSCRAPRRATTESVDRSYVEGGKRRQTSRPTRAATALTMGASRAAPRAARPPSNRHRTRDAGRRATQRTRDAGRRATTHGLRRPWILAEKFETPICCRMRLTVEPAVPPVPGGTAMIRTNVLLCLPFLNYSNRCISEPDT